MGSNLAGQSATLQCCNFRTDIVKPGTGEDLAQAGTSFRPRPLTAPRMHLLPCHCCLLHVAARCVSGTAACNKLPGL